MFNIASYQEGYTDGFEAGKTAGIEYMKYKIKQLYNDNYETESESDFLRGYNLGISHMLDDLVLNDDDEE